MITMGNTVAAAVETIKVGRRHPVRMAGNKKMGNRTTVYCFEANASPTSTAEKYGLLFHRTRAHTTKNTVRHSVNASAITMGSPGRVIRRIAAGNRETVGTCLAKEKGKYDTAERSNRYPATVAENQFGESESHRNQRRVWIANDGFGGLCTGRVN
jgi:hypothetical protein